MKKLSVGLLCYILLSFVLFPVLSFSDKYSEPLFLAISAGDVKRVQEMLKGIDVAKIRHENESVLHAVLLKPKEKWNQKSQKILEILISAGADVNAVTFARTPLDLAVHSIRDPTVVKTLLSAGADPNLGKNWFTDSEISSPYTANSSTDAINEMLISAGAKFLLIYKKFDYKKSDLFSKRIELIKNAIHESNPALDDLILFLEGELKNSLLEERREVSFKEFKKALHDPELDLISTLSHYVKKGILPAVQVLIDSDGIFDYYPFRQLLTDQFSKDEQAEYLKRVRQRNLSTVIRSSVKELNFKIFQSLLSTGFYGSDDFRSNRLLQGSGNLFELFSIGMYREPEFLKELLLHDPEWIKTSQAEKILHDLVSKDYVFQNMISGGELSDFLVTVAKPKYLETLKILISSGVNPYTDRVNSKENEKKTAFERARRSRQTEIIKLMKSSPCQKLFKNPH